MNWSWTDFAFRNEVTILGWGLVDDFPREGFSLKGKGKGEAFFQRIVQSRITEYKRKGSKLSADEEEGDEDLVISPYVRIVSWTPGELCETVLVNHVTDHSTSEQRKCRVIKQQDIPLVIDVAGKVLSTVFNSRVWAKAAEATGHKKPHQKSARPQSDNEEDFGMPTEIPPRGPPPRPNAPTLSDQDREQTYQRWAPSNFDARPSHSQYMTEPEDRDHDAFNHQAPNNSEARPPHPRSIPDPRDRGQDYPRRVLDNSIVHPPHARSTADTHDHGHNYRQRAPDDSSAHSPHSRSSRDHEQAQQRLPIVP